MGKTFVPTTSIEGFIYEMLLGGLKDEDPDSFRSYLRMDIDSFDYLLNMLIANVCSKWQKRSMGMTQIV